MYDCKRGECGVCQATVLEGEPDHRDYYLSDTEKASGKIIQICISRAKSARLFATAAPRAGDQPFEVELRQSAAC